MRVVPAETLRGIVSGVTRAAVALAAPPAAAVAVVVAGAVVVAAARCARTREEVRWDLLSDLLLQRKKERRNEAYFGVLPVR